MYLSPFKSIPPGTTVGDDLYYSGSNALLLVVATLLFPVFFAVAVAAGVNIHVIDEGMVKDVHLGGALRERKGVGGKEDALFVTGGQKSRMVDCCIDGKAQNSPEDELKHVQKLLRGKFQQMFQSPLVVFDLVFQWGNREKGCCRDRNRTETLKLKR